MSQEIQVGCMRCGPCNKKVAGKLKKSRSEALRLKLVSKMRNLSKWHAVQHLKGIGTEHEAMVKRSIYDVLDTAFEFLKAEGQTFGVEIDKELRGVILKWGAQHGLFHKENGEIAVNEVDL